MEERPSWETITIYFDGRPLQVTSGISIKEALQLSGFPISPFPKEAGLSTVLCQTPFGHIGPHVPDERR